MVSVRLWEGRTAKDGVVGMRRARAREREGRWLALGFDNDAEVIIGGRDRPAGCCARGSGSLTLQQAETECRQRVLNRFPQML
jgi:hypothetical protein